MERRKGGVMTHGDASKWQAKGGRGPFPGDSAPVAPARPRVDAARLAGETAFCGPAELAAADAVGRMTAGTIRFFNEDLGYGIIVPDNDGEEIIFYITRVEPCDRQALRRSRRVRFAPESDGLSRYAVDVMLEAHYLEWSPRLRIGLSNIDAQHRDLIAGYMRLMKTLDPEGDTRRFQEAYAPLMALARQHFDDEERVMRNIRFDNYHAHKAEHDRLLRDARDFQHSISGHFTARECAAVAKWIRHWLITHIEAHDLAISRFVQRTA